MQTQSHISRTPITSSSAIQTLAPTEGPPPTQVRAQDDEALEVSAGTTSSTALALEQRSESPERDGVLPKAPPLDETTESMLRLGISVGKVDEDGLHWHSPGTAPIARGDTSGAFSHEADLADSSSPETPKSQASPPSGTTLFGRPGVGVPEKLLKPRRGVNFGETKTGLFERLADKFTNKPVAARLHEASLQSKPSPPKGSAHPASPMQELRAIMDPRHRDNKAFVQFAVAEWSSENLDFIAEVDRFVAAAKDQTLPREHLARLVESINSQFVDDKSPRSVNIPSEMRKSLQVAIATRRADVPGYSIIFQRSQDEILKLVSSDTLARFKAKRALESGD